MDIATYMEKLKSRLLHEFETQNRTGVYAYTQKNMAYNSSKIEGSTLTSEQTASLFDTGTVVADALFVVRARDIEETNGHFKMFNELLKNLDAPLSASLIKSLHYQLKNGVFYDILNGNPVGEYKNRANQVADIVTVLPENVPLEMEHLVDEYNQSNKTLADIAKFHARYELIHPFQDGNGRTGRAIMFKQCMDSGIIPFIIPDTEKELYYHHLHKAQMDEKYDGLISFFEKQQAVYFEWTCAFLTQIEHSQLRTNKIR